MPFSFPKNKIRLAVVWILCLALVMVNIFYTDLVLLGWWGNPAVDNIWFLFNISVLIQIVFILFSLVYKFSWLNKRRWMSGLNLLIAVLGICYAVSFFVVLSLGKEELAFYERVFGVYILVYFFPLVITQLFWIKPVRNSPYLTLIFCFLINLKNWWTIFFQ